jgi:hypothetical protein
MNTQQSLAAALGVGFYRYWHVPAPSAFLDIRDTRRADLSVIGSGALAILAIGSWAAGRLGTALLLDERVTAPLDTLPATAQLLVNSGMIGIVLAVTWWLATAPVRTRVAAGVDDGYVARIPDEPAHEQEPLHAAAAELGRTLRKLPDHPPTADPAFEVLQTAVSALSDDEVQPPPEQRRLRRMCLSMVRRLVGDGDPAAAGPRDRTAA